MNLWRAFKDAANEIREVFSYKAHDDEDDYERMMRQNPDIITLRPDEYEVVDIND